METAIQSSHVNVAKSFQVNTPKTAAEAKLLSKFWQQVEFNRFGIISILLVVVAIMGGFAAAVTIQQSALKLAVVALSTAMVESFILAVMPMRTIIFSAIIAISLDILMMII